MNLLAHYSALSGYLPAIAALIRYKDSPAIYKPFFILLWVGALNDTFGIICGYVFHTNILNSNIYVLAEFIFLLVIFYRWNGSVRKSKYVFFGVIGLVVWIADNLVLHNPVRTINSLYRVYYCAVTIFMSIDLINRLIVFERKSLLTNPMFIICISFVFFFSYKAYIESFYILSLSFSEEFYNKVFFILGLINVLSNLVYTVAILCIPKKQEFYMQ